MWCGRRRFSVGTNSVHADRKALCPYHLNLHFCKFFGWKAVSSCLQFVSSALMNGPNAGVNGPLLCGCIEQRGILSAHAPHSSFNECSRWYAPAQNERANSRHSLKTNWAKTKLCAIVFPFESVCPNIYCERDGKRRKVEAWVYNLRKKSQWTPFRSVDSVQSNADLEACFGFVEKKSEDICEACRKAL